MFLQNRKENIDDMGLNVFSISAKNTNYELACCCRFRKIIFCLWGWDQRKPIPKITDELQMSTGYDFPDKIFIEEKIYYSLCYWFKASLSIL